MTSDPIDAIADARDALDRAGGAFARAQQRLGVGSGSDETGEVVVRVKPDGTLDDVVIGTYWSRSIDPATVGAAVMAAYTAASVQILNDWGTAVVEQSDEPPLRPMPDVASSLHARLNEITDQSFVAENSEVVLNRFVDFLEGMNAEIDDVTAEAESVASAVSTGAVNGVEVSVNGMGSLVDVRVDRQRAAGTNGTGLAQSILRAYKVALREARSRTVDDVIAGSRLGELQRLAADPRALAERFGLT